MRPISQPIQSAANAKLCHLAAELGRFVAHGIGTSEKPLGYAAQRRSNGVADAVGGLHGTGGRAPADALQAMFDRPLDFADIWRTSRESIRTDRALGAS
jgi:hypothetical protein